MVDTTNRDKLQMTDLLYEILKKADIFIEENEGAFNSCFLDCLELYVQKSI